jgi:hypothetical protein
MMQAFLFLGNKMYNVLWLVQILEKIQGVTYNEQDCTRRCVG